MHKTVCVFISKFCFVVDTTKRMSIPLCLPLALPSYCDDDDDDKDDDNDEPNSTYILQFVCFSFATRHLNIMVMKRKKMV